MDNDVGSRDFKLAFTVMMFLIACAIVMAVLS
jgi:hypothetical protein